MNVFIILGSIQKLNNIKNSFIATSIIPASNIVLIVVLTYYYKFDFLTIIILLKNRRHCQ